MPYDTIEKLGGSLFHHGKANDRLYLMKWDGTDPEKLIETINRLAGENGYSKAFIKIPERHTSFFSGYGFEQEARIPEYYGPEACVFMGKFWDPARKILAAETQRTMTENLALAQERAQGALEPHLSDSFTLRPLGHGDTEELAKLYRLVFKSYPFPIHDPEYLGQTMEENIAYFGIFSGETLVAASSAEMDMDSSSVEFTDFATNPDFRGNSFASVLLTEMEKDMERRKIRTYYTIARALSAGMNITFSRAGYRYAGTLVNNTDISGTIESMNVWYR